MISILVLVYLYLWSTLGFWFIMDTYGAEAFRNPGGIKFPRGEVIPLLFCFLGMVILVALELFFNGIPQNAA